MTPLLHLDAIEAGYGASQALFGVSLQVGAGEFVTLLGRNGMGKSTLVKVVCGLLPLRRGAVRVGGVSIANLAPHQVARLGLGLVPEGRQIFGTLSVRENLVATARLPDRGHARRETWTYDRVIALFPRLAERERHLGSQLSGGEQQMLAIGRALMTNPRLLILDEATEGLAPLIRAEIWARLAELKASGLAILCIDKNLRPLLALADRHVVLEKGHVVWQGDSTALRADLATLKGSLGV